MTSIQRIFSNDPTAFSSLIIAKRGSGKSFFIKNTLLRDRAFVDQFDKILILVGSPDMTYNECQDWFLRRSNTSTGIFGGGHSQVIQKIFVVNDFDESIVSNVMDQQERHPEFKVLLILDDCGNRITNKKRSPITELTIKGRHYGISYIITSQSYKLLNPTIRTNSLIKVFFKVNNQTEMKKIVEENATRDINEVELEEIIDEYTKDYNYFIIKDGNDIEYFYGNSKGGFLKELEVS